MSDMALLCETNSAQKAGGAWGLRMLDYQSFRH
jgi:hypothetical protein